MGHRLLNLPSRSSRPAPRAFTAVEILIVLLIMSIVAVLAIDFVASFEANQRAERAAREVLAAFRYARSLAMTTGKDVKVVASPSAGSFSIYLKSNGLAWDANPVSTGLTSTGTWVVKMGSSRELVGTSFTITATPSTNTVTTFNYGALGNCVMNAGADTTTSLSSSTTITFAYGTKTKRLVFTRVGDPTLQ